MADASLYKKFSDAQVEKIRWRPPPPPPPPLSWCPGVHCALLLRLPRSKEEEKSGDPGRVVKRQLSKRWCWTVGAECPPPSTWVHLLLLLLLSVDRGHLVQAVLLGFEPQVCDAVGHVHSLGRVGVGAGGRVGRHGAGRREGRRQLERLKVSGNAEEAGAKRVKGHMKTSKLKH